MQTLADELPKQMARVRDEVLPVYDELPGGAGFLAASMMRADLNRAARALAEGDVVEMIRVCKSLEEYSL